MSDWNPEPVRVFHGRALPEPGTMAGYAAIRERFDLPVPLPSRLAAIAQRHGQTRTGDWLILTPRHAPESSLAGHLEFALKWEGVNLGVLKALFKVVPPEEFAAIVRRKPTGAYTRRLWFLFEWLMEEELPLEALGKVRSVPAADPKHHYVLPTGPISKRHKVVDNLPGTRTFCPLVRRTEPLEDLRKLKLGEQARAVIGRSHPDLVARAAAFLLLSDSRASFGIEGEQPSYDRTKRWGQAIGEAGTLPFSVEELERLQAVVIGDDRFVKLGIRRDGGFVGDHDRISGAPIPKHISAAILRHILEYRRVLESHSKPLLRFIEWRPTDRGNVEVLNETADYYRYFDATAHAEFLYHRVFEGLFQDCFGRDDPA